MGGSVFLGKTPRVPRGTTPAPRILHPQPQSSSPVPPHYGGLPVALPELEAAPGSRVLRLQGGQGSGVWMGRLVMTFLSPSQGLCTGTVCCVSAQISGHGVSRP